MKKIFISLCLLFIAVDCKADYLNDAFYNGIKYYKESNYTKAIEEFKKITDKGIVNGMLYYNLGNAYLKNKDLGNAILWYERSQKLIPNDPDLKFNIQYALSLVKDQKEDEGLSLFKILIFWRYLLSKSAIQWIAIYLNIIFLSFLCIYRITRYDAFKISGRISFVLFIIFCLTAIYDYYENTYQKKGVILPSQVSVRSGLTEDSSELFRLHAGTLVIIEKENKDFVRIYFLDDKIGWIKKSDAGII